MPLHRCTHCLPQEFLSRRRAPETKRFPWRIHRRMAVARHTPSDPCTASSHHSAPWKVLFAGPGTLPEEQVSVNMAQKFTVTFWLKPAPCGANDENCDSWISRGKSQHSGICDYKRGTIFDEELSGGGWNKLLITLR